MLTCTFENSNVAHLRHVIVDAIVLRGSELLMVKRAASLSEGGKWGLIGGYFERDETLEECVRREVLEETGYTLGELKLLTIRDNPNRRNEDRQNVAFVYICQVGKLVGTPDWESDEVKWWPLSDLPPREQIAFDHTDDIDLYLTQKKA